MSNPFLSLFVLASLSPALSADDLVLPPGTTLEGRFDANTFTVFDLTIAASNPSWPAIQAWLVLPSYYETLPVVVYQHLYGRGGDRDEFLVEAISNTRQGWGALLLSGLVPWEKTWVGNAEDLTLVTGQLESIGRAVAFLKAQEWTDADKLLYVGHDYGAMFGALLAGRQAGFKGYALMAPSARWSDWKSYFGKSMDNAAYDKLFGKEQPILALARPSSTPVFLQFAEDDRFVGKDLRSEYASKVASNVTIRLVSGAVHEDVNEVGQQERLDFMRKVIYGD